MAQTITMNYRDTLKKAQELEELADEMDRKCAARIDRLRDGMRSNWTGDAAAFYCKKLDQLEGKARNRAREMRAAASALRIAAERYRILEMIHL
jgi:uncharacterized protein YukE